MSLSILNKTNKKSQILLSYTGENDLSHPPFGYCYAPLWWLVLHVCWFGLGRLRCFPEQSRWEAPRHVERNKHHFGFSVVWWQIADGYFRAQPLSPDSSARLDGCLLPLARGCRACPAFACAQGFIFSEQKMRFFCCCCCLFYFLSWPLTEGDWNTPSTLKPEKRRVLLLTTHRSSSEVGLPPVPELLSGTWLPLSLGSWQGMK